MVLRTSNTGMMPVEAFGYLRSYAAGARQSAQQYLAALQAGPVDTPWVFTLVDQLAGFIANMNRAASVAGLDAYATNQGYSASLSADASAATAAAQACITWVVNNFPKDNTNNWLLAEGIAADGSRTPRNFSTAQTTGLQTALQNFIATMS